MSSSPPEAGAPAPRSAPPIWTPPPPPPGAASGLRWQLEAALAAARSPEAAGAVRWIGAHLAEAEGLVRAAVEADPAGGARLALSFGEVLDVLGGEEAHLRVTLLLERFRGRLPGPLADEVTLILVRDALRRRVGSDWAFEAEGVLERAEQRRDPRLTAMALRCLASAAWQEGRAERSLSLARRAGAVADPDLAARLVGNTLWGLGQHAEAEAAYVAGLATPAARQDPLRAAALAANLGSLLAEQGRHAEAVRGFAFALRVYEAAGGQRPEQMLRCNLGMALIDAGQLDEAEQHLQRAWTLRATLAGPNSEAGPVEGMIALTLLRGRPAEALNLLAAGSGVDDADPWYDGQLMVWRAFALAGLGQLDRAREEALAGARRATAVRDAEAGPLMAEVALAYIDLRAGRPASLALEAARAAAPRWQALRVALRLVDPPAGG